MSGTLTKSNTGARAGSPRTVSPRLASELGLPLAVLIVAAAVYGAVYFRENSIATAIGANLVPAERVLEGEVPYRDFYKIQTPGILLLNAALFKLSGVGLLAALRGVLVFKVFAVVMVFLVARRVVSWKAALVPTALSLLWLAPGGPFRPAPIQYETPLVLAAVYFTLRWADWKRPLDIFVAGLTVGLVALFKQNVGAYCAVALGLSILLSTPGPLRPVSRLLKTNRRTLAQASAGVALPLAGLFAYLAANRALVAAMRVFIEGPGEHIQMKLTGYPLPKHAAVIFVTGALAVVAATRLLESRPKLSPLIWPVLLAAAAAAAALVPSAAIDNSLYWFTPPLAAFAAWQYARGRRGEDQRATLTLAVLLLFALASYGEVFPRSVRGLIIGTLPAALILFAYLFAARREMIFGVVAVVLLVFALRLTLPFYFDFDARRGPAFKADTELSFDRGRGVYLPRKQAAEVDSTVSLIQERVEPGGYFFAHSVDTASYYFLADRNSPTGATLWNDAGTNDEERVRTLDVLRQKGVRLILTNEAALAAERFGPLVDHIRNDFHEETRIGKIIFLERNY